jgi:hypothetical protein
MKIEFLDDPNSLFLVPSYVAVCPVCQGPLAAFLDESEQPFVGVNLYMATRAMLTCLIDDHKHQGDWDERWEPAYEEVMQWLGRGGVLLELPDAFRDSEKTNRS